MGLAWRSTSTRDLTSRSKVDAKLCESRHIQVFACPRHGLLCVTSKYYVHAVCHETDTCWDRSLPPPLLSTPQCVPVCVHTHVCVCVDTRVHLHVYCVHACMYLCTSKQIHFVSMWMCMFFFCRSAVHYYKEKDTIRWWRGCAHVASKHIAVLAKTHSFLKREMSTHICIILFLHITLPPTFVNSRIICQIEITDLQIIWECWKAENTIYFLKTLFDTVSRITSQFNVYL